MPAGLDSGAVLRALADHPDAFPALRADVAEFARKAMVKQLKDKALTLDGLRRLARAGSEEAVATVFDDWSAAELAGLAKKVDVHGAKAIGDEAAMRRHLVDLAGGRVEPSARAAKVEKAIKAPPSAASSSAASKPKIGGVLQSKVHSGAARPSRAKKAP